MCGIVGYCLPEQADHKALLDTLAHRGPDSRDFIAFEQKNGFVGFGHTRLSILDLSPKGKQPMQDASGQVFLTFNGEIYNFQDLKATYLSEYSFQSETDTEVILNLYLKFGISFVDKLNGDFAFAIADKRSHQLHLVRDRAGIKPLYFSKKDKQLLFASEIKTLFSAGLSPALNEAEIQPYFVFKYVPEDQTLVKGVQRVPPAHILTFDWETGELESKAYWELKKNPAYTNLSYKEAIITLRQLLADAIKIRLISDVPIGNFLSGGLDSSIIALHLKKHTEIQQYCAVKDESDLKKEGSTSDGFYAKKLAAEWKLDLQTIVIGSDEANAALIDKTLYYSDDLIADGSQIPSYLITKEAEKKAKVMLSGMGADELFLGYAGHQITLLSRYLDKIPLLLRRPIGKMMRSVNQGKGRMLAYRRYIHKLGKYALENRRKYAYFNIVGDFEQSAAIYPVKNDKIQTIVDSYFTEKEALYDSLFRFEFNNFLQKNLHYMDRMSMANGVETRVPFLDHRIIEFAYSIPRKYKLSASGKTKKILKDAYAADLPDYVIKRRKAGFGMPLRSIFSSEDKIYDLLDLDFFANFQGFSMEAIKQSIAEHLSGRADNSSIIYALISFQHWYQLHLDKQH